MLAEPLADRYSAIAPMIMNSSATPTTTASRMPIPMPAQAIPVASTGALSRPTTIPRTPKPHWRRRDREL